VRVHLGQELAPEPFADAIADLGLISAQADAGRIHQAMENARKGRLPAYHLLGESHFEGFKREVRAVDFRKSIHFQSL
jgi:hypothetical protein